MEIFELTEGVLPLVVSIPHAGTRLPDEMLSSMTPEALALSDTDWDVDRLYGFAKDRGASVLKAHYSRYVIDLNRPPDNAALYPGQVKIDLCPLETFDGESLYKDGLEPDEGEIGKRLNDYWHPYHQALENELARIKKEHGYVLLYDAHSIRSYVPRLFEGELPALNLGTCNNYSCAPAMAERAFEAAGRAAYKAVLNGRFIGGYITRYYGDPAKNIHALQMEIGQDSYRDTEGYNEALASALQPVLGSVWESMLDWAKTEYAPSRTTP